MATTIEVSDAQSRLAEIVCQASAGEEFVLVDQGKPMARLSAVSSDAVVDGPLRPRVLGLHPGDIQYISDDCFDPLPDDYWSVYQDE